MTREELNEKVQNNFAQLVRDISVEKIISIGKEKYSVNDCLEQYDPYKHDVVDPKKRPDKIISEDGEVIHDAVNGVDRNTTDHAVVPVNRLPIPVQKRIVLVASTFLVGDKIGIESNAETDTDKTLETLVRKIWKDNKLDYRSKEIAKIMKSETHCAELWYDYTSVGYWKGTEIESSTKKFGVAILAESKGDKLYPIFDEYNDLIGFGRGYSIIKNKKTVQHFDLYTDDYIIKSEKEGNGDWKVENVKNHFGAIPIVYYSQEAPEWADVQPLINRKENRFSDFADTNDYFADPALVAEGQVENLPSKGEIGKSFGVKNGGKVSYLTWDSAPESMRMEFEMLDKEIYAGAHSANLSFESMKTVIGSGVPGISLKLLFMDMQIKANDQREPFGMLIQRRLNLLIKLVTSLSTGHFGNNTLSLYPIFKDYMPVNDVEYNDLLIRAHEKGMISKETMVSSSTLVKDPEQELEKIKKEDKEKPKPVVV